MSNPLLPRVEAKLVTDAGDLWMLTFDPDSGLTVTCTDLPEYSWTARTPRDARIVMDQLSGAEIQQYAKPYAEVAASLEEEGLQVGSAVIVHDFLADGGTIINRREASWLAGTLFAVLSVWP